MITIAFLKALGIFYIMTRLPTWLFRRILGHVLWAEVFFTVILPIPLFLSGTLGGAVIAMMMGIFCSALLHITRNIVGWESKNRGTKQWEYTPGPWSTGFKQWWKEVNA